MLGEDFFEEYDSNIKNIFENKKNQNTNERNNQNDYLEFDVNKTGEDKKEKPKKKKKKICENCKALNQKIKELEQLNIELLKIKGKLSQENEELSKKNEEITQINKNIVNQNNELIKINEQLKEEKENLINKNKQLIEDNNKIKKELNTKVDDKEEFNNKQKEKQNINISNKIEIKNNNITNTETTTPNKELIYTKKKESINLSKYCSLDEFNNLKLIVEELQTKVNSLEQWKKNIQNVNIEKKEVRIISPENNINENVNKVFSNNNNNFNNINNNFEKKNIEKLVKKNSENDKLQKIKSNFEEQDNSSSDESNGYSNTRTAQNNNIPKKIKPKQKSMKKTPKKELNIKIKRVPSKSKELNSIKVSPINNINNSDTIKNPPKSKTNKLIPNPYNIVQNNSNIISTTTKEKLKHKNQKLNSKIITSVEELDLIARGLVQDNIDLLRNLRVGYKLIYRASEHGGEAEDFHEQCDGVEGTLVIIKTKDDFLFGGYTKVSWDEEEEGKEKNDTNAFVFSINLEKLYFYFDDRKRFNIICDKNKGPCFVGMLEVQEHILKGKGFVSALGIQSFEGENEKYEINGGKNEFIIEEMEVFRVIMKAN